jgi:hypothetical protein
LVFLLPVSSAKEVVMEMTREEAIRIAEECVRQNEMEVEGLYNVIDYPPGCFSVTFKPLPIKGFPGFKLVRVEVDKATSGAIIRPSR